MRIKLILILVSAVILTLLALLRSNFYASETYIRWRDLTWDDFKGVPVLFTGWGARISSDIYTEYDSVSNGYVAFAAMNNQRSWKKLSFEGSYYTLNHEQYHFNLTESFARLLNERIKQDSLDEYDVSIELKKVRERLYKTQSQYDEEADHGLNEDMQRYWEYKIDSMLLVHSGESGITIDYISEASMFLPLKASIHSGDRNGSAYRSFGVEGYDMILLGVSSNYYVASILEFEKELLSNYEIDSFKVVSYSNDANTQFNYNLTLEAYNKDSSRYILDKWILKDDFLYELRAIYPVSERVEGYQKIANSVLNSFDLVDSRAYWKNKLDTTEGFYVDDVSTERVTLEEYKNSYCAVYNSEVGVDYGVIGNLVLLEDGYIIPFSPTKVDSSIYEVKIITKDNTSVSQLIESYEDYLFVPKNVNQENLEFSIGYTLKEDTSQVCFQFYNNYMIYDPAYIQGIDP